MIDFHCHLDLYPKPAVVISEVAKRGTYVLAVTTTPKAFEGNLRYVGDVSRIRVAVGLHPELVKDRHHEVGLLCATLAKTRYVGEVGLDGSPDHRPSMDIQREVLRKILGACVSQGGRIVSLHSRMAAPQVLDEIEIAGASALGTPILHWYSGSATDLVRAIDLGCWFSVGPAMLASRNGRKLATLMPKERVLPETDGPFGQSEGRSLCPWDAERVLPVLAELWGEPEQVITRTMKSNLRQRVS